MEVLREVRPRRVIERCAVRLRKIPGRTPRGSTSTCKSPTRTRALST